MHLANLQKKPLQFENRNGHKVLKRLRWRIALEHERPLPPIFLQNHAVFRQFKGENPYFELILGSGPPLGSKPCWAPLTKILDRRLVQPVGSCSETQKNDTKPLAKRLSCHDLTSKQIWRPFSLQWNDRKTNPYSFASNITFCSLSP